MSDQPSATSSDSSDLDGGRNEVRISATWRGISVSDADDSVVLSFPEAEPRDSDDLPGKPEGRGLHRISCFIGPNGSGKTSTLRLIEHALLLLALRLQPPDPNEQAQSPEDAGIFWSAAHAIQLQYKLDPQATVQLAGMEPWSRSPTSRSFQEAGEAAMLNIAWQRSRARDPNAEWLIASAEIRNDRFAIRLQWDDSKLIAWHRTNQSLLADVEACEVALASVSSNDHRQRTAAAGPHRGERERAESKLTRAKARASKHHESQVEIAIQDGGHHEGADSLGLACKALTDMLHSLALPEGHYHNAGSLMEHDHQAYLQRIVELRNAGGRKRKAAELLESKLSTLLQAKAEACRIDDQHMLKVNDIEERRLSSGTKLCLRFSALINEGPDLGRRVILWDEPETSLHPTRRHAILDFMRLSELTFVVATHTPEFAAWHDDVDVYLCGLSGSPDHQTTTHKALTRRRVDTTSDAFAALDSLGVSASRVLFAADTLVWVEGPSDVVFWRAMLRRWSPHLRPGFNYTFVTYGGANITHLEPDTSAPKLSEDKAEAFTRMLELCRSAIVIADSDQGEDWGEDTSRLKSALKKLMSGADQVNADVATRVRIIVPRCRELENVFPPSSVTRVLCQYLGCREDEIQVSYDMFDSFRGKVKAAVAQTGHSTQRWTQKTSFAKDVVDTLPRNKDELGRILSPAAIEVLNQVSTFINERVK